MRAFIRRSATFVVLGALAVGTGLPAAAQSGRAQQITHRQSILTELSPTGEPGTSRVFTQLTAIGDGTVTVALPDQSTSGLRSLEGFGGPDVNGDEVIHTLDASSPEGGFARTVADNTAELPVSVSVRYLLDGTEVEPSELAGQDGEVTVEYTVRNLTAEPRDIVSFDVQNNRVIETMDVAVPMVGTLQLVLPPTFTNIDAPGGITAGNGRGSTVLNYTLLLFSPLGSEETVVTWTADSVDTQIPDTSLQILPVDDNSFASLSTTSTAYKGAADSLTTLGNGALIIDSNLKLLGSGAAQLLDGLQQLADGAGELSAGLSETAAPGARTLSEGLSTARGGVGELNTGLGTLAMGATRLSDGLSDARAGATTLSSGLGQLADGAGTLRDGLGSARDGGVQLEEGIAGLPGSVRTGIRDNLGSTLQGTVLPGLEGGLEEGLEENLIAALQGQFGPELLAQIEPALVAGLAENGVSQFIPLVLAGLEDPTTGMAPALAQALKENVTGAVAEGVRTQVPPLLQVLLGASPEDAAETAATLAGVLSGQLNDGFDTFAPQFVAGFLAEFKPSFEAGMRQFATLFGEGFVEQAGPLLNAGFETFGKAFAPQFAAGFAESVSGSFQQLSTEFAAGFAEGLEESLNEQAMPGFATLNDGLSQLSDGSKTLADGLGDASDGSRDLVSGLGQLDDGSTELAAGARTAADGIGTLAAGMVQLDDGAAQLADGLGDAAEGSVTLAEGLDAAEEGGTSLADGTVALQEGFENQLIAGVSEGRQGAAQDYEQVKAVIARGKEGAAPYGIAQGADATTVFQFDVAGVGTEEGPSTPLLVVLALVALAVAGGLGLALKRRLAA